MSAETHTPFVPHDTLANRLVLVRRELGLTQREAADRAGVGFGSWQSWENGASPQDAVRRLAQVADALGVDREWLLFGGPLSREPSGPDQGRGLAITRSSTARSMTWGLPSQRDPRHVVSVYGTAA